MTGQKPTTAREAEPQHPEGQQQKENKPDLFVYAVIPNGRGTRIGSRLGVVFNHKTGGGFTIYLDGVPIPVDGQIELVAYPPKP